MSGYVETRSEVPGQSLEDMAGRSTGTSPTATSYALVPLIVLCLVYILYAWDRMAIPVELVEISRAYGLQPVTAATLSSIFTLGISLFVLPAGLVVSYLGIPTCFVGSIILFSLATGYTAIGISAPDLLVARCVTGLGEAVFSVCLLSFLSSLSERRKGMFIGLSTTIYGLSGIVGAPLIGAVQHGSGDWRAIFYLLGGGGLVFGVILKFALRQMTFVALNQSTATVRERFACAMSGQMPRLYAIIAISGMGTYSVITMLVNFERTYNSLSLARAAMLFSFFSIGSILGGAPLGLVADIVGQKRVIVASAFTKMIAGTLLFMLPFHAISTTFLAIIFGIGVGGIYVNACAIIQRHVAAFAAPTATGILLCIYYVTASVSGPVFQQVMKHLGVGMGPIVFYGVPYAIAGCIALTLALPLPSRKAS